MCILNKLKKVSSMLILSIIFISSSLVQVQSQERSSDSTYSELLISAVKIAGSQRVGFQLVSYPITGLQIPKFKPIKGLDNSDAVPFLIDVLVNGPDWSNQEITQVRGGVYPYIAHCYAALCLGNIGDKRAYEPLLEIMQNSDLIKSKYNIRSSELEGHNISDYAAIGLGYLGDTNAIEPLIDALQKDNLGKAIDALTILRDIRAIEPIMKYASENKIFDIKIHYYLEHISRVDLNITYSHAKRLYSTDDFSELGEYQSNEFYQVLWQHWFKNKDKFAKQQFEDNYNKLKKLKNEKNDDQGVQYSVLRKMLRGGISVLPYIINEIENGDEYLVIAIDELFYPQRGSAGFSEKYPSKNIDKNKCLDWWEKNKEKWLISSEK